ncbi:MAG: PAS domain S-box protein [Nitrospirota bacterium]|nr:MAG: PAS domain S-box protein [Nitrospirota bacterium]
MKGINTLRARLTMSFILIAVLPLLIVGLLALVFLTSKMKQDIEQKNLQLAKSISGEVERFLDQPFNVLTHLSDSFGDHGYVSGKNIDESLRSHIRAHKYFNLIMVLDRSGRVINIFPFDRDLIGIDMSKQHYYKKALELNMPFWGRSSISVSTGRPATTVVFPSEDHTVVGYLDLISLRSIIDRIKLSKSGYAAIVDDRGTIIAHKNWDLVTEQKNIKNLGIISRALEGVEGTFEYEFHGVDKLGSVAIVPQTGWVVIVNEPVAEAFAPVNDIKNLIFAGIFVSLLIAIAVSFISVNRILMPIRGLEQGIRNISDGDYGRYLQVEGHGVYEELKNLSHYFNVMIDDIKRRENAIAESENRLRSIYEQVNDGILLADMKTMKFFDSNSKMREMLGYSKEEISGLGIGDIHPQESLDAIIEKFEKQARGELSVAENVPVLRRDGSVFFADISSSPVVIGDNKYMAGVFRDITASKEAEEERLKLEAQLRHSQRLEAVGKLAGGVAHDFNNILTAIIGYGNVMLMKMEMNDPQRSYLENILSAAEKAATLTHALLAYSRKQVLQPQPTDLNRIIQDMERLLRRLIGEDVKMEMKLSGEKLVVVADTGQIEQVLMNLVMNSRDSMPDGGDITVSTRHVKITNNDILQLGFGKIGEYAVLTVNDNGTGMDELTRGKIFEPFFTTKEVGKGTGLGLSMVYGIVKQHNGYLKVDSVLGEGTTFDIYIPLSSADIDEKSTVDKDKVTGGSETILVGEDNETVSNFIREVLEEFGYKVLLAQNGNEVIELYTKNGNDIDLLLLDVVMPVKSGKAAFDEIKMVNSDAKAIFMSGYTADLIQLKGVDDSNIDFIYKPLTPVELLEKIREVMARK